MSVVSGHSADYLTGAVATGRENYYTGATAAGEPPGRWYGRGAEALGLAGEVDTQDMTALYERFIDPRDEHFRDPAKWDEAQTLGHTGRAYKTQQQLYQAALAREPGADAERRTELMVQAGQKAQQNVTFHDATFSVQKSVTVLHTAFEAQEVQARGAVQAARGALAEAHRTGDVAAVHRFEQAVHRAETEAATWTEHREAVEEAIWAGNRAALDYLADKAGYVRVGHHGGASGRWADAHEWTVASFFQHDSREHDPQLHVHNAILNRVQGADGKWRTLDSKAMYKYQSAAGSVGERVLEQHLTRTLGVQFKLRDDGEAREIVGIDQDVMDLFSTRRRAITKKTAALVDEFRERFERAPNGLELDRLQQQATLATRKAKSPTGETVAERLERWDAELRAEVSGGLRRVADQVLATRQAQPAVQDFDADAVLEQALARVQETQAEWRAGDLTRAISLALPDELGAMEPGELIELLDGLTAKGLERAVALDAERPGTSQLPEQLRLANGESSYRAPGRATFATPGHLNAERALARAGYAHGAPVMTAQHAKHFVRQLADRGLELGGDQAAAVQNILCSGAKVEALIGPAGTGKSRVVGALAKAWEDPALWHGQQRRVVGLAASQVATEVLAADGVTARNITRWLQTQASIAAGTASGEYKAWALSAGDLVVVDESGMANTKDLASIQRLCDQAEAKLLLVGDQRQLAAVGAGGGMGLVTGQALTHELTQTHRFAADWEGPASLRLRTGDQTVLGEYHRHGRIIDGGHVERAETLAGDAWLADRLNGQHSLLIVDTNEQAARVAAQLRNRLVNLGLVDDKHRVQLGLQGTYAGRGDLIQARKNDWSVARLSGNRRAAINRGEYEVLQVLPDGSLRVAPLQHGTRDRVPDETMTLPARYVAEHVALGYAATVNSAQGLSVDTAHAVASSATSLNALYVEASRGRHANTIYVVTRSAAADAETGETAASLHRTPVAVLASIMDSDDERRQRSATEAREESATEAARHRTPAELLADGITLATASRAADWLDEATAAGLLTDAQRTALASEAGAATLTSLLRRVELAGQDPRPVLIDAIERRGLDDAKQLSNVIHARITKNVPLDPNGTTYSERLPHTGDPQWDTYLRELATQADATARDLAFDLAEQSPAWLTDWIGNCPDHSDPDQREAWIARAAAVAGYRDLAGYDTDTDAIGPAPAAGQTETYAAWRAAWDALGRPADQRAEAEMTTGQLRVRVAAYQREQTWAPPYVREELSGTAQAAERARTEATLRDAEAAASSDPQLRDKLAAEAAEARALAQAHDARAAELQAIEAARGEWLAHTAATRAAAGRAARELDARDVTAADERTTAAEWLAAERDARRAEDPHRAITDEQDFTDIAAEREHDLRTARASDELAEAEPVHDQLTAPGEGAEYIDVADVPDADLVDQHDPVDDTVSQDDTDHQTSDEQTADEAAVDRDDTSTMHNELAPADVRVIASDEDRVLESATARVPSADEIAEGIRRAQRALIELRQREQADSAVEAAEDAAREEELARWHADDTHHSDSRTTTTSRDEHNSLSLDD
ncbi:MobF family relaxase [Kribbella flavida]|nr:MobF family relaxase [Kribbella flavida]